MNIDDIYSTIRNLDRSRKVFSSGNADKFYGIDEYDVIAFEYDPNGDSSINIVCPRDPDNNFMYVEINSTGINFTKIYKGGKEYEVLGILGEDEFFQEDTIINLGFSFNDYKVLYDDFMKYYDGFLKELTVHL